MKPYEKNPLAAAALAALLALPVLAALSCGKKDEASGPGGSGGERPLTAYTTFYPTWFFTAAIGGKHVRAVNPIPAGEDPIFFQPPPEMVRLYQEEADLIVLNGAGYARWTSRVMLPEERIVNAGASFENDLITIEDATVHSHGQSGEHSHAGIDGHTWMDPVLAMEQCRAIAAALKDRDPDHAADFDRGLREVLAGLEELDRAFKSLQAKGRDLPIVASHPAYNYLCRRYGWDVKSFDFDPAAAPAEDAVKTVSDYVNAHPGIRFMVWEKKPAPATAEAFRFFCGLEPVEFAPVETPPGDGLDYFDVMKQNVENIRPLFKDQ